MATADDRKLNFGFWARMCASVPEGELELNDRSANVKVHVSQMTGIGKVSGACGSVPAADNTLEFTGKGSFNGAPPEFRACVQDNGDPGRLADLFYLECTSGCAYATGARVFDNVIAGGNIDVERSPDGAGNAAAGEP